jgi:hypothetical protein
MLHPINQKKYYLSKVQANFMLMHFPMIHKQDISGIL